MDLALMSGIPPSVWAEEGERAVATAYDLLRQRREAHTTKTESRKTSG